jgi:pimeloyl-ACP methyl ester carboxylesterase
MIITVVMSKNNQQQSSTSLVFFVQAFQVVSPESSLLSIHSHTRTTTATTSKNRRSRRSLTQLLTSSIPSYSVLSQQSSTTTTSSEEETISLEWTEYYKPKTSTTTTSHTPVLLLHGLLGSKRNFASLGQMLGVQLEKQRPILGVDLRNHGDTLPWSSSMSYEEMVRDVVRFLDAQGIDKIVLVGHSMGGKVAQAMALLYPDRVEGLVVLDIAPVTYKRDVDPHWKAVEDILHAIHQVVVTTSPTETGSSTRDELDKALRPSIPDPALRAFVLTNYDNRTRKWKIPIRTLVEELEQIAGFDIRQQQQQQQHSASTDDISYDGDVFIIHGGQSRFVRHSYMDAISSYFPNHMLTTVRG